MEDMDSLEMICFGIISHVGVAKTSYINAIAKAKEGDFEAAEALIKEGDVACRPRPPASASRSPR